MQETQVLSLGQEDPLEEQMVTHSSIPAWEIAMTEEPGGLQYIELQRVRYNLVTKSPPRDWTCLRLFQYQELQDYRRFRNMIILPKGGKIVE